MEEKTLTPQESMEVIARMIEASKQRLSMPDLRISVLWAVLTIATAAIIRRSMRAGIPRRDLETEREGK